MPSEKRARQRAAREARLAAEAKRKKQRQRLRNLIIVVVVAAAIVGIAFLVSSGSNSSKKSTASTTSTTSATSTTAASRAADARLQAQADAVAVKAGCPASTKTRVNTQTYSSAPPMTIDTSRTYTATVSTTTGNFVITLDAKSAPKTVNNFVFLAEKGYYHCVIFHRVIPSFMDQTGDPTGTGTGGPGYTIPDENPPKATNASQQYPLGSVAMANTGAPNSGGSQWFIVSGPEGESLPNSYALFGQVTSGMSVVETINQQGSANGVPPDVTQRILSVTISST
ncbi:MAG TPA: peptidylprolyl isomerase [Acidimicrobiales bacterium]|nr:peptidylprolyl isomerase [Acidimicrobiales bacterium]